MAAASWRHARLPPHAAVLQDRFRLGLAMRYGGGNVRSPGSSAVSSRMRRELMNNFSRPTMSSWSTSTLQSFLR